MSLNGFAGSMTDVILTRVMSARAGADRDTIKAIEATTKEDRCLSVRKLSDDLAIFIGSCHSFLTQDLGKRRVAAM